MHNIKRVLIAIELDKEALEIIEYGITLALIMGSEVKVLHVTRPHLNDIDTSGENWILEEKGLAAIPIISHEEKLIQDTESLEFMVDEVRKKMNIDDLKLEYQVTSGMALPVILDAVHEVDDSLLIVGMQSSHANDFLFGSVALELIDRTDTPIVLVPYTYVNRTLDKIALAINFEFSEFDLILHAIKWSKSANLGLTLFHIEDDTKDQSTTSSKIDSYMELLAPHVKEIDFSIESRVGKITQIVEQLSSNDGADLIVMREKKRHWNLLPRAYESSTSIARKIRVPLLLWKDS